MHYLPLKINYHMQVLKYYVFQHSLFSFERTSNEKQNNMAILPVQITLLN
jgi:hypothetical protein